PAIMKANDAVAPGRRRRWGRAILASGQVAVSVVLLVVAMFMYRGFRQELLVGPGYRTDHLMMMGFDTSLIRYTDAQSQQFFQEIAERARAVPGVKAVTMTTSIPMLNDTLGGAPIAPEGFQFPPGKENIETLMSRIDEYYFNAMGIPLVSGRHFTRQDDENAPRVAIVNQHLAQHYWPNQDPLGKRFRLKSANDAWVEIVGVAKTSKYIFISEPPTDFLYLPYRQNPASSRALRKRRRRGSPGRRVSERRRSPRLHGAHDRRAGGARRHRPRDVHSRAPCVARQSDARPAVRVTGS